MKPEVICDQLLQEIPLLLSKNNPEFALLYFQACLHFAERGRLLPEKIISLIEILSSFKSWLGKQQQSLFYERLLKLAESNQLAKEVVELNQILGLIHKAPPTIHFYFKDYFS